MTTTRKSTTPSKAKSAKKGLSSPIKKKLKAKPLPAGVYNCTIDSLVGTKLTLNVNDLTLKDTVKLGLKLKITDYEEPKLHPEGMFDALILGVSDPKESKLRSGMYYATLRLRTDLGIALAAFYGTIQTVMFLVRNQALFIGTIQEIRIRHRIFDDRKMLDVTLKF